MILLMSIFGILFHRKTDFEIYFEFPIAFQIPGIQNSSIKNAFITFSLFSIKRNKEQTKMNN